MFNKQNGALYTGVTTNLVKRVWEHKEGIHDGFFKRYKTDKLGYYVISDNILSTIEEEKRIKGGSRKQKIDLIESMNLQWRDLFDDIVG